MDTIPDNVRATAAAAGLGEVRRRYRCDYRILSCILGLLSLVGPVLVIAGPFADDVDLAVGLGVIALCLLWWYDLSRRVIGWAYLCEHGVLMPHRWRKPRLFRWDDVAHLWPWDSAGIDPISNMTVYSRGCDVELTDGSDIRFGGGCVGTGTVSLADEVEATLTRVLYRRRLKQVRAEGRGEFGPITVEPTGLHSRSRMIGWGDIAVVEVGSARLRARDRDRQVRVSGWIRRIPELNVLLTALTDHGVTIRHTAVGDD